MKLPRYILKAIWAWQDWRFDQRMKREQPEWFADRQRRRKAQKRHGKVKPIDARLSGQCHAKLQRELAR